MWLGNLDSTTLLLGGSLFLLVLWWLSTRRPPGLPPSPGRALPFLGHAHLMDKDARTTFTRWRRQYGDIFSIYVGGRLIVVLCGFSVLKEAFVKMGEVFSHRPIMGFIDRLFHKESILFMSGGKWREVRKASLEILREMGMGKNVLAEKIQEEISHYVQAIEDLKGEPTVLQKITAVSVSNNICSIIFGKRFNYDDHVFTDYLERIDENLQNLGYSGIIYYLSYPDYIPGDPFGAKKVMMNMKYIHDTILQPQIDHHKQTYDEGGVTDFIYAYLRRMKERQESGEQTALSEFNLRYTLYDLFMAGSETTTTSIGWTLLLFLHYPQVQEKCYEEICQVIGTGRLPSIRDRTEMVYLEATICEVLRVSDIGPFGVQHATASDVKLRDYVIPKGTVVMPFVGSVLADPELWGDPENFRPERFINIDGTLLKPEELIVFGLGRRACIGESLARMELFLYLATLVQRFRFLPAEPDTLPSLEGIMGAVHIPEPYKIRAVPRE